MKAIDFKVRIFGATESFRWKIPGGEMIMQAELRLGNTRLFLRDRFPNESPEGSPSDSISRATIMVNTEDVDTTFNVAIEAGKISERTAAAFSQPPTIARVRDR